jgi:demethylmenaquinone methyltransferase/2-methoxy-6-polyprenyl-1,4-benzoquinol methylase
LARAFEPGAHVLDVGTGTGDLAKAIASRGATVVGVDFSEQMIRAAQSKMDGNANMRFAVASADRLPFETSTFDGLTSAFVIRNLHHGGVLTPSFKEFHRVLKPGGQMIHLELTQPHNAMMLLGYKAYMKTVLPSIGWAVFGSRWPKNYLNKTIENLPPARTMCQWMRWAGFDRVCHYPLSKGIASLFVGWKPNA